MPPSPSTPSPERGAIRFVLDVLREHRHANEAYSRLAWAYDELAALENEAYSRLASAYDELAALEAENERLRRVASNYGDAVANLREALGIRVSGHEEIVGAALVAIHENADRLARRARRDENAERLAAALVNCMVPYMALMSDKPSQKWIAPAIWSAMQSAVADANAAIKAIDAARVSADASKERKDA